MKATTIKDHDETSGRLSVGNIHTVVARSTDDRRIPSPSQPISRQAHRLAVSATFFMHGLCFASWASRIPSIQERLNLSDAALGGVLFALPLGFFLSLPFAGWLIGKAGSRYVVIPSAVLYSICLLCIGVSSDVTELTSALFFFGFFANLLNISINTQAVLVEGLFAKRLMATFHGLWSLAGFAGAAIGTWMIVRTIVPLHHFILISATFVVAISICAFFLVRKDGASSTETKPLFALPDRSLIGLGLIAFCSMMAEGAMFDWSGIYFNKVVGVVPQFTGIGYTTFMIAMAGMRFLADGVSGKIGVKRILQGSGLCTTVGLLLSIAFPNLAMALIGFFIVGIGVSSVVPMVYSAAGKSTTMSPGMALTAVSSFGFMGFLIGPPLIGFIAEASSLKISFLAMALMAVAVFVLSSRFHYESNEEHIKR